MAKSLGRKEVNEMVGEEVDRKRYARYGFKNNRLVKVEDRQRIIPTPEEAVKQGFENAPRTVLGLLGGGIIGALIGGPIGALIGGTAMGGLGYVFDQEDKR